MIAGLPGRSTNWSTRTRTNGSVRSDLRAPQSADRHRYLQEKVKEMEEVARRPKRPEDLTQRELVDILSATFVQPLHPYRRGGRTFAAENNTFRRR